MVPRHLRPAIEKLERFRTHPFEFVFSVPPRHGKTELILHFVVWALLQDPTLNIAYVTYSADSAEDKSSRALQIAEAAGLHLAKKNARVWRTPHNEHVLWTGVGGPLTGKGFRIIIIDDPHKNRVEAESKVYRDRAWDFFQSDLYTRLEPGGSLIEIQTRWHEDDLAGRLTRNNEETDWTALEYVNLPAISNEGTAKERALWPEQWPLAALRKKRMRVGNYAWTSLYQGQPRPRGASVFGEPTFFTTLPRVFQVGRGLDLAYTAKTRADFSVLVTLLKEGRGAKAKFYVVDVVRKQLRAPEFKSHIKIAKKKYGRCPILIYGGGGPEKGAVDLLRSGETGVQEIRYQTAVGDKYVRAGPVAAAWNAGLVMVPEDADAYPWVNDYLDEMRDFTGVKDAHDDQVDATAPAFDSLQNALEDKDIPKRPKRTANTIPSTRNLQM